MFELPDDAIRYGLKLAGGLALLAVGLPLLRWLTAGFEKAMLHRKVDLLLAGFVRTAVTTAGVVVLLLAALQTVGVPTGSFLAVLGTAGLAIGLALKDSLSHLAAGVMLMVLRPFRAGDYVRAAGQEGTIVRVRLFQTTLRAPDNRIITLPNSSITTQPIVNFTECERRRTDLELLVALDAPIATVLARVRALVEADARIERDPAPLVMASSLSERGATILVQVWTAASVMGAMRSDLIEAIQRDLPENGCRLVGPGGVPLLDPAALSPART